MRNRPLFVPHAEFPVSSHTGRSSEQQTRYGLDNTCLYAVLNQSCGSQPVFQHIMETWNIRRPPLAILAKRSSNLTVSAWEAVVLFFPSKPRVCVCAKMGPGEPKKDQVQFRDEARLFHEECSQFIYDTRRQTRLLMFIACVFIQFEVSARRHGQDSKLYCSERGCREELLWCLQWRNRCSIPINSHSVTV